MLFAACLLFDIAAFATLVWGPEYAGEMWRLVVGCAAAAAAYFWAEL